MPKKSNPNAPAKKPAWPFPQVTTLTADVARNQWVKRIHGKLHSFGVLSDPKEALRRYQRDGPALHNKVEVAAPDISAITLGELCGRWVESRRVDVALGKLQPKSFADYEDAVANVIAAMGPSRPVAALRPLDFEKLHQRVAERFGPARLGKFTVVVKMMFRWGHDAEICPLPHFGRAFKGVSAKDKRDAKNRAGKNLLTAAQVRHLVTHADPLLRAAILLGISAGLGNNDVAQLRLGHLTRAADPLGRAWDWVDFPRPKTAVAREFPLWPETREAIDAALAARPLPANAPEDLIFLTREGRPLVTKNDHICREFAILLQEAGFVAPRGGQPQARAGRRPPLPIGFYTLRRTFRTVADATGEQHAIHRIMGHTLPGMSGVYVQELERSKLITVSQHVRDWLWTGWSSPWPQESPPASDADLIKPQSRAARSKERRRPDVTKRRGPARTRRTLPPMPPSAGS